MKNIFEIETDPRSFPEDSKYENGGYINSCVCCENEFMGHKHRIICKICQDELKYKWDSMTEEEQTAQMIKNCAILQKYFKKDDN